MVTEKRLIDANALIENRDIHIVIGAGDNICIDIADIAKAPTVDAVEVVHGQWFEHHNEKTGIWHYDCSICDDGYAMVEKDYHQPNYCHNCGAKMDEVVADG